MKNSNIMKRTILMTLALLAAALLSCNKTEKVGSGEVTVNYTVAMPMTKASLGNGEAVNYVWYALYRADGSLVQEFPLQPFAAGSAICPVTMVRDQSYSVVFVAQHYEVEGDVKTPAYAVDAATGVLRMPQTAKANSDNYDVFCYVDEVVEYQGATGAKPVTLTRKVAQVNYFCTSEDAAAAATLGMTPTASEIVLTGVPESYDIIAGQPSLNTVTVTYGKAALTGDANLLGTAYCLAGDNLTKAELKLYKGDELTTTIDVENLPVETNKRTNITGAIMTGTVDYQISLEADVDETINH